MAYVDGFLPPSSSPQVGGGVTTVPTAVINRIAYNELDIPNNTGSLDLPPTRIDQVQPDGNGNLYVSGLGYTYTSAATGDFEQYVHGDYEGAFHGDPSTVNVGDIYYDISHHRFRYGNLDPIHNTTFWSNATIATALGTNAVWLGEHVNPQGALDRLPVPLEDGKEYYAFFWGEVKHFERSSYGVSVDRQEHIEWQRVGAGQRGDPKVEFWGLDQTDKLSPYREYPIGNSRFLFDNTPRNIEYGGQHINVTFLENADIPSNADFISAAEKLIGTIDAVHSFFRIDTPGKYRFRFKSFTTADADTSFSARISKVQSGLDYTEDQNSSGYSSDFREDLTTAQSDESSRNIGHTIDLEVGYLESTGNEIFCITILGFDTLGEAMVAGYMILERKI